MEYFEYTVKNHLTGKKSRGIVTSDNIESAEETLKRRGEDIIEISLMPDLLNIRKKIYNFSTAFQYNRSILKFCQCID